MVSSALVLALASVAAALKVTSPSSSSVWSTGKDQTVTWESVSSDQDTFNIYLSNMASYPSTTILLASDVSSSAGSATIDGSKLTTGDSFTINFTNGTETEQIYAQSNQFNITEGSTSSSSSSSAASTASSTTSSSTGTVAPTSTVTLSKISSAPATTLISSSSSSSSLAPTGANHVNGTGSATGTATATATGADSSSTASGTASSSGTSSGSTATGTGATASSTSTSGAGKVVAGWVGFIGLAVLAL